jgi:hypothetical protein
LVNVRGVGGTLIAMPELESIADIGDRFGQCVRFLALGLDGSVARVQRLPHGRTPANAWPAAGAVQR